MSKIICDILANVATTPMNETLAVAHTSVAAYACKSLGPDERLNIVLGDWDIEQMSRTHLVERRYLPGTKTWLLTLTPKPAPDR